MATTINNSLDQYIKHIDKDRPSIVFRLGSDDSMSGAQAITLADLNLDTGMVNTSQYVVAKNSSSIPKFSKLGTPGELEILSMVNGFQPVNGRKVNLYLESGSVPSNHDGYLIQGDGSMGSFDNLWSKLVDDPKVTLAEGYIIESPGGGINMVFAPYTENSMEKNVDAWLDTVDGFTGGIGDFALTFTKQNIEGLYDSMVASVPVSTGGVNVNVQLAIPLEHQTQYGVNLDHIMVDIKERFGEKVTIEGYDTMRQPMAAGAGSF